MANPPHYVKKTKAYLTPRRHARCPSTSLRHNSLLNNVCEAAGGSWFKCWFWAYKGHNKMIDLSVVLETAARDPLVVAFGLMVLGGLTTHFLCKHAPFTRAIVRVVCLPLLTMLLLRAGIVPYRPLPSTGSPFRDAIHGALQVAWWLWTAWFLVSVLRAFVIVEYRPREGKLLQDLLASLIYLAAIFAIMAYVFALPIQGLLATSGVVAIMLGLALQNTLGDVFAGLVLSFSRPYRPGDWISLDGGLEGRVIELNWRATHVLTGRRD